MSVLKSWISPSIVNLSTTVETTTPTSVQKKNSKQTRQKHITNNKTKSPTSRNSSPVQELMYPLPPSPHPEPNWLGYLKNVCETDFYVCRQTWYVKPKVSKKSSTKWKQMA